MRSKQQSPSVLTARLIPLPANKQEADSIVAAIIEGRQDEPNQPEGQEE